MTFASQMSFPQKCLVLTVNLLLWTLLLNVRGCLPTFHNSFKILRIVTRPPWKGEYMVVFSIDDMHN